MKRHLAVLLIASCAASLSTASSCLHYGGEPITLSGKVTLQTFFGPPNYGENPDTDSRETQGILVLVRPVCVSANPVSYDMAETNQVKVTLVPPDGVNLKNFAGKRVTVQGTLFHAITGHHHTPVLMQVSRIEKSRE